MRQNHVRSLVVILLVVWMLAGSAPPAQSFGLPAAATVNTVDPAAASQAETPRTAYSDIGSVTAIAFAGSTAWVGTADGHLVRLDTRTGEETRFSYPTSGAAVRSLVHDARGNVWVATEGGGLGRFDGKMWQVFDPSNSDFPSKNVRVVTLDPREQVWAATDAGVATFDGKIWIVYDSRNSGLVSDNVTALLAGAAIWCGTDAGLSRLVDRQWKTVQTGNSGLPDNHITALVQNHRAGLLIGTDEGAFMSPGASFRTFAEATYYSEGSTWTAFPDVQGPVYGIAVDAADRVWLNLSDRLGRWSECGWWVGDAGAMGLPPARIAAMALDPLGRLWVGGEGGLARLVDRGEQGEWSRAVLSQPVRAIAVGTGQIWAALARGGIVGIDLASRKQQILTNLNTEPRSLALDARGRMWAGTWGRGVSDTWTFYTRATAKLPSDFVAGVAIAANGTVWAGTQAGIAAFDPKTTRWRNYPNANTGLKGGRVLAVAAASDGRVAFGSYSDGVSVYDGRWTAYNTGNSAIPSNYVRAVAFDASGALWIGTAGAGVARLDGDRWTAYPAGAGGPTSNFVTALTVDPSGHLWAATADGELSEFDGCGWTHYPAPGQSLPTRAIALAADPDGRLWVGGEQGLFVFTPAPPQPIEVPTAPQRAERNQPVRATLRQTALAQSLPDTDRWINHAMGRSVHSFAFTADGFAWVATLGGGVIRWRPSDGTFTRFVYPQDGLPSNHTVFVKVDPVGRLWVGTQDRGVAVYDGKRWTAYDTRNSPLSHDYVNGVTFDSKGRAWLATLGGGVCMFDGKQWTVYRKESGLAGDQVWYVAADAQDRIWAGTIQGLSVFSGGRWTTFPDTSNVHCIAFDDQGRTWFGDGDGLNRVEGQTIVQVREGKYDPWMRDVYSIQFDRQGVVWLGTGLGIFRYDGAHFSHITVSTTGLRGIQVYAVGLDPQGRVWFGTDGEDGAASFDPQDRGNAWQTYSTAIGPNPVSNRVRRLFVDRQGRVWMGGGYGVSVYDGNSWVGYTHVNSDLVADNIESIAQGPDDRLWFGTRYGISIFDGREGWETIHAGLGGLLDNGVRVIRFDPQGHAWIGTANGLSVFDGTSWHTYTEANTGLDLRSVEDIAFDKLGRVWVVMSTPDVYVLGADDKWSVVTREEYGLDTFSMFRAAVDPAGRVWLATFDGLTMFDGQEWTPMDPFPGSSSKFAAFDVAFDGKGQVWVAGYGGVAHHDGSRWITYTAGDSPLLDSSISAVAVDAKGHVWFGSDTYGVSELIPAAKRFPVPATATPSPTIPPAVPPPTWTPTPRPAPSATPTREAPTTAPQAPADLQAPAPRFAPTWQNVYGGDRGGMGYAVAAARQVGSADERFEHGLMIWLPQTGDDQPQQAMVYALVYGGTMDSGTWQAFPDLWQAGQPDRGNFAAPPGLSEPVRGFGKVWRKRLGGGPNPPAIGWATEVEQGAPQTEYQDFQGGRMLYSSRLNIIFVLKSDGTWRAFGG